MITDWFIFAFLGVLLYAWVLYPCALLLARGRRPAGKTSEGGAARSVAVLLAAHNEEANIRARLENLLALKPVEGVASPVQIVVGVDASSDRTAEIAREFAAKYPNVQVREFA